MSRCSLQRDCHTPTFLLRKTTVRDSGHFTRKLLFWQQIALGFLIITPARELAITIFISRSLVPWALPRQLAVFKVELLFTPTPLFARHPWEGNYYI
jgi:hypothetical protein